MLLDPFIYDEYWCISIAEIIHYIIHYIDHGQYRYYMERIKKMGKNVQFSIYFIIVIFFSISGIEGQTNSKKGNEQIAFVSILPQRDIVQAIAGYHLYLVH